MILAPIFVQFRMWGPFILSIPTYSKLFPIIQVGYQFIGKPYRTPSWCARTRLVGMRIIILHFPQQNSLGPHPLKTTTAVGTAKRHPWRLSHGSYGPKMSWHLRTPHKFWPPHGFSLCLPFFCWLPSDFFSGAGIFDLLTKKQELSRPTYDSRSEVVLSTFELTENEEWHPEW